MTTTDDPLAAAQRALSALGERFNKLAVENKRLEEQVEEAADVIGLIRTVQLKASPENLRLECSLAGNWSVWEGGIWRRTKCTSIGDAITWAAAHCGITLPGA